MSNIERLHRLRCALDERGLRGCIISNAENIQYFSGFSAGNDGWLYVDREHCAILTDGRYWEQVESSCPDVELIQYRSHTDGNWSRRLATWLYELGISGKLGFEGDAVSYFTFCQMREELETKEFSLISVGSELRRLRICKDDVEIDAIRKSAEIADIAWKEALKTLRVGMTEMEFCAELEYQMKRAGSSYPSFDTIVASGPNGSYPHSCVTDRPIGEGELITVDFGAVYRGYHSDITRTVWLGELSRELQQIYELVKRAHDVALQAVCPGIAGRELDKIARDIIEEAGFGEAFNHSLGHGVGLEVHEGPNLRRESQDILSPGMLVTIEPGVYIPGLGGCRTEDLVLVTEKGYERLSNSPYQAIGQSSPILSF